MARKTKKEKIIADLRRKLNVPSRKSPVAVAPSSPTANPPQSQSLYIYPVQLIKKDLTKTLVLCILTISLEIALFLMLEKKLVLPFRINF